ncbi:MAG: acyltransferase [Lachnospiraceae bacterium]|nr:acyltransferase [Lachnospiraceae bacterium]
MNLNDYSNIIVYGIGEHYHTFRDRILCEIKPDYVCDAKLSDACEYDGIKVVLMDDISGLENPIVVFALENKSILSMLSEKFEAIGIAHITLSDLFGCNKYIITRDEIIKQGEGNVYVDSNNNRVEYDSSLSPNVRIEFVGGDNRVKIGKNVVVNDGLYIGCSMSATVEIGSCCEMWRIALVASSSKITIGDDCLFSKKIKLMTHDGHHIFDRATGKRLNYSKDITLGNQVWVGEDVLLLGGANIGDGSIIGAKCVTSSTFPDHVIIAGGPGKVIRENVIWSKDSNFYFNHDNFDECIDKRALKYLDEE